MIPKDTQHVCNICMLSSDLAQGKGQPRRTDFDVNWQEMTDTFSCQGPNDFALKFNRMVSMSKKVSLKWQVGRVVAQWVDCLCSTYRGLGSIAAPH